MVQELYAAVAVALSLAMCGVILYFWFTDRSDREAEEEAREFFDAHGHWPDETPT
jgi:hypothetical protein